MSAETKLYALTETYTGERTVYVRAASKSEALAFARGGDIADEGEPRHFNYRYRGPVREVEGALVWSRRNEENDAEERRVT